MKIRIDRSTAVRLDLQPGDELSLQAMSPQVEALLVGNLSGGPVAHLVRDGDVEEELAVVGAAPERAVTGRRGGERSAAVPR